MGEDLPNKTLQKIALKSLSSKKTSHISTTLSIIQLETWQSRPVRLSNTVLDFGLGVGP